MDRNALEAKACEVQTKMRELQYKLERALIEYINEHGDLDFTKLDYKIYTTLNMWGETGSTSINGVRVKQGVLLVVAEDGQEYDYDNWTNDTLVDICYCTDSWTTQK